MSAFVQEPLLDSCLLLSPADSPVVVGSCSCSCFVELSRRPLIKELTSQDFTAARQDLLFVALFAAVDCASLCFLVFLLSCQSPVFEVQQSVETSDP